MKYLPPAAPKLVQKLKMLRIYLNLTHLMFKYVSLDLHVKNNFYQIFTTCQTHISPKFIKNLAHRYFKYTNLDFNVKNGFYEIFASC